MKKMLLLSSLAAVGAIAVDGCANDTTTTTQRSYSMDRSDPKDMSTPTAPAPAPAPATNAADTDDESGGIHSSGNMGGMH